MEVKIDTSNMRAVGTNIRADKQGDLLILVIDTTVDAGLSSSGKMRCVAKTDDIFEVLDNSDAPIKGNIWMGRKVK